MFDKEGIAHSLAYFAALGLLALIVWLLLSSPGSADPALSGAERSCLNAVRDNAYRELPGKCLKASEGQQDLRSSEITEFPENCSDAACQELVRERVDGTTIYCLTGSLCVAETRVPAPGGESSVLSIQRCSERGMRRHATEAIAQSAARDWQRGALPASSVYDIGQG